MNVKRIALALILAGMAIIPARILRAQSGESTAEQQAARTDSQGGLLDVLERQREAQAQRLEGSWVITVTAVVPPGVPPPPVRNAYVSFARGGASILSDRLAPFANPGHGAWEHRGGNEFAWTFIADNFDAAGNFLGTLKVRVKIIITGSDTFVGVDNAEVRSPAGNLVFSACNTIRGERIKVEPLAEQCQGITPPQ
jgi:hypothetical protein